MAALGSDITISIIGKDMASPAFAAAGRGLDDLEKKAGAVGTAFNVAMGVIAVAATGIAAGIGASITAAATFEKQMSAVGAVAGATGQELQALSSLALQLGKDTSFSAVEAAQGIEELVKAGLSIKDIMGGGAKGALDLAAAGAVSVKDAAEIAANAMNVFNLSGERMGHVADVIAGAANASAIDVNDFKFSLSAAGAVAATVGVNFEDLATGIAVMGQSGIKGSDAGTSLKTMLLNLQPSTKAQTQAFKDLGLITADGSNKFFDATGKAKGLADIAGVLQDATKGMTDQQKLATLEVLFGSDAIRAAAVLSKAGAEGFNEMAAAIGKVSAADVANARLDNLAGSLEKLDGSVKTASITIGRAFLPALKRMVDGNTATINAFIPTLELWAEQIPGAIDIALAAFDGLKLNVADTMLRTANFVDDWWNRLAPNFENVRDTLASQLDPAFTVLTTQIFPAFAATAQIIGNAITTYVLPAIGTLVTEIGTSLSAALNWFTTTGGPGMASFITGTLNPALQSWYDWIGPKLQPAITWLFQTAIPTLIATGQGFATWITGTAVPALMSLYDWLYPKLEAAYVWLTETAWPTIQSAGQAVVDWIMGPAVAGFTALNAWFQANLTAAWTWLTGTAWPAIQAAGQTVIDWIAGPATTGFTELNAWFQEKLTAAWTWLTGTAWPGIQTAGQAVLDWITGPVATAFQALADWLQPKIEPSLTWLTGTGFQTIISTGTEVVTKITEITTWIGNVGQAISSNQQFWTNLDAAWRALSIIGAEFVTDVLGPMDTGLKDNGTSAKGFAQGLAEVLGLIKPVVEFGQQLAETLNSIQRAATDAGLGIRAFLQSLGVPMPSNPIPGIIPSAPGSQRPGHPGVIPPDFGPQDPNRPVLPRPEGPVYGPAIPPGFEPGRTGRPASGGMPPYTLDLERRAYQYAVEAGHPNPVQFVEQIRQESQFDPNAYNTDSGASGIAQIVPRWHPSMVGKTGDPDASLRYAAGLMTSHYGTYGDPATALAAYNAGPNAVAKYGGVPPFPETQAYIRLIGEREAYARSLTGGAPEPDQRAAVQPPAGGWMTVRNKKTGFESQTTAEGWAQTQNKDEFDLVGQLPQAPTGVARGALDPEGISNFRQTQQAWAGNARDANAICGPRLAALFADAVGRPPTPEEARELGQRMNVYGPGGFLNASQFDEYGTALIQQINPGSTVGLQQTAATGQKAGALGQEALAAGSSLVGFNTPGHYFGATDYDANTGKFNVGGTGTSYANGKEWMSISEIEALGGAITGVITMVDSATGSFATMSTSVQTVGAAAAAGAPQLASVGAAINPVVAAFSEGQASAASLTDAIITQAGFVGVATDSSAAYSQGLIGQDEAMRNVLAGFAETTPAAAALLAQMDAGTISTEQAAVAFAGLAATTAESTGALAVTAEEMGVLAEVVPESAAVMAEGTAEAVLGMTGLTTEASTQMADDVAGVTEDMAKLTTGAAESMAENTTLAAESMATNTEAAAESMATETEAAAETMATGVTTAAETMGTEVASAADTMSTETMAAAEEMATGTEEAAGVMATGVEEAATTMAEETTAAADEMNTATTGAAEDMSGGVTGAAEEMASGTTESFGEIADSAGETTSAMEEMSGIELEPPDVDGIIDAMKDVQKAAEKAREAVKAVGSGGGGGDEEEGEDEERALGGPVRHGERYLVGERGPELFVPSGSGWIVPNHQLRGMGGDAIDYDRLARAIAKAGAGKTYSLTVNTQASHEPIIQDFAILESLSRSGG